MENIKSKVEEILKRVLPSQTNIIVTQHKNWVGGGEFLKIMFAVSKKEINSVREQFPQVVSLSLELDTMELRIQVFAGMGGGRIYREVNKNNPMERHYAMMPIPIPFRRPKKEEKNVLMAIEKFAQNWLQALKDNKDVLRYKDLVDYDEFFQS